MHSDRTTLEERRVILRVPASDSLLINATLIPSEVCFTLKIAH